MLKEWWSEEGMSAPTLSPYGGLGQRLRNVFEIAG